MTILENIKHDIQTIKDRDPAATSTLEILTYSGLHAVAFYRVSHWFYVHKHKVIARCISQFARMLTGIEIHPGAKIGKGLLIDHGSGVVIGETAEIGDYCLLYQGCTLGGTGKDHGKRHPTLGNNVMVGCGAKVLGPFTVGDNAKIAANAVVLEPVPANSTAVGVPARIVKQNGKRTCDLDQVHIPDPVAQELCQTRIQIAKLEKRVAELEKIGLLDKPHTSAGRIPSAQGYRYYVDELLNYNDISMQEIKYIQTQLATKVNQIEDLTKIATSTLSEITHYTSVGIGPRVASQNIEEVKFVLLGSRILMAIILTESGLVKETIIKFDEDVTQEQVDTITYLFNNKLKGKPLTQIDKPMEEYMHSEMSSVLNVVKPVLEQLNKAINEDAPIYMEGANKSFDLPEFKSLDIAKNFVNILDTDKTKQMIDVLNSDDNQDEINVYIGDENVDEALKDFSIITFKHKEEGKDLGTIAIIGPTRMDYSKVISAMKYISKKLGENSETPKLDNPNSKERKDDDNG